MTSRRVIVGVDGRPPSLEAARAAVDLVPPGGTIVLARVLPTSAVRRLADRVLRGGEVDATAARREREAGRDLARLAAELGSETPARVEVAVARGRVADALLRLSAERGCDLLVIGARRPRPRLGGVAGEVARRNPGPTLVVREGVPLAGVRGALVLARAPLSAWELELASAALPCVEPRYAYMTLRGRSDPGLGWELEAVPRRAALIVPRGTAVRELGASWLLRRAPCHVLFLPEARPVPVHPGTSAGASTRWLSPTRSRSGRASDSGAWRARWTANRSRRRATSASIRSSGAPTSSRSSVASRTAASASS